MNKMTCIVKGIDVVNDEVYVTVENTADRRENKSDISVRLTTQNIMKKFMNIQEQLALTEENDIRATFMLSSLPTSDGKVDADDVSSIKVNGIEVDAFNQIDKDINEKLIAEEKLNKQIKEDGERTLKTMMVLIGLSAVAVFVFNFLT